ncbi:hypothetical protein BBO99_00000576 [Phytophthora kernoviae]|uniref:Uncharacterized protein n=2 Tax=Phytophthora kernoviae TaxID=325452 RepID=A0A3R7H5B3_9STRA|nr:hypothetical protein G195_001438 [Phytophthora kernoviae 00238/432]KAG2532161.1 hypothetical protein JM16_000487 [Phytophthora kernoviae]KAG2533193.1 hypothetical protein JM18_000568 [Phytophthora kernoviae]RLN26106.1 hypothetical protein BBI17_000615 [Phytophthora kernoviae]RLN85452.1 hypothetical protein BBO99_00000576 [Phytophthora kernoviae]
MMYLRYADDDLNVMFISLTLLSVIVLTALSVVTWVNVGLLPSAVVSLYLVFLCYQTVRANPNTSFAISSEEKLQEQPGAITNALIAAFTITWTSWRTSATDTAFFGLSSSKTQPEFAGTEEDEELASIGISSQLLAKEDQAQRESVVVPEYQFHVLMVLASLYMAMVLTNWGSPNGSSSKDDEIVTMWVKAISQWVVSGLFLWTLVAPTVFPGRDFS